MEIGVRGLGFGVWGLGVWGWGLGFGVWGSGFGVYGLPARPRAEERLCKLRRSPKRILRKVSGLEFGFWGLVFGVWGLGFGVCGLETHRLGVEGDMHAREGVRGGSLKGTCIMMSLGFGVWGLGFGVSPEMVLYSEQSNFV